MVVVSVSETYDLHTEVNKMTLIGIHTPTKELIQKTYPGLAMNCKYFRVKSVDVVLSTAQTLPLGVGEIGLDTGKIHPQDMMNPILYKAVSNDSWSTLEARLHGLMHQTHPTSGTYPSAPLAGSMAFAEDDNVTGLEDEHGVYYSLLSNRDGFKIAHPRDGLRMKGLVPLVFEQYFSHGENQNSNSATANDIIENTDGNLQIGYNVPRSMRGRPHPMPRINTTYLTGITTTPAQADNGNVRNGMGDGTPLNSQVEMPDIPPVMLGCIVLPPVTADTGILYYRMVTRAYIEFTDVRPIQEIASFASLNVAYAPLVYHTDYPAQSSKMDATTDMVDIKNGNIEKIMEGR